MSFQHPWLALTAAAIALPILVLLYVLKLRRRRLSVASTLLWVQVHEDLEVNTPFRRLRLTALFVVQLLLLLALIAAIGEPGITGAESSASRVILLIDHSASMNATDGADPSRSRLDEAKERARRYVDRMARRGDAVSMMIIAFGVRAEVVTGYESRRDVLYDAIESVRATDEEARLQPALQLAGTFAGPGEREDEGPPDVVLISDGGVAPPDDPAGFLLRAGRFQFDRVGPEREEDAPPNLGIVSLAARRNVEDPGLVHVFVRLLNAAPSPVETVVRLSVDGAEGPIGPVQVDGATPGGAGGEATTTFTIERDGGAVITAQHGERDAWRGDDTAAVVLPAATRPRMAIVHGESGPDARIVELLEEFDPQQLRRMDAETYESMAAGLAERFDVLIFDRVRPSALPDMPSLSLGVAPPGIDVIPPRATGGMRVLSWRRQHPIMRHVSLDSVVYAGFGGLELPAGATTLAAGPDGPLIGVFRANHETHVVVGFEMERTNWSLHVSVAVFMQNVIEYLTAARSGAATRTSRPGDAIVARLSGGAREAVLTAPHGAEEAASRVVVPGEPGGWVTLPRLSRAGVYSLDGAAAPWDRIAVSTLSDVESDIRPRASLIVNAESIASGVDRESSFLDIWPWLVGLGVVLLLLEWAMYCRAAAG